MALLNINYFCIRWGVPNSEHFVSWNYKVIGGVLYNRGSLTLVSCTTLGRDGIYSRTTSYSGWNWEPSQITKVSKWEF